MSQEYTPVEWIDETPTTQGTTINKQRLDQMQSAHHYADGFEEVDSIPTEDPGVGYHKIVYCTADRTIYRWDGSEWTKDIDDATKALLDAHIADRNNPHGVTKAQVGLGNADNTSDADKPISTATQEALNIINGKIPAAASASNQLADKDFVNSSISTNTANFLGTYDAVTGLGFTQAEADAFTDPPDASTETAVGARIAAAVASAGKTATNNDYVFISVNKSTTLDNDWFWRFKYNGTAWVYEFTLNNSSFTADQWAAINSGITAGKVADYDAHIASRANPHGVTAAQVGLGSVADHPQDDAPTQNSDNYVKSGGVFSAVASKQDALVSGVNIKTIGGQSLLGSGDIPAGGLNWTFRENNDDWSDMFQISGGKFKILKHVYLYKPGNLAVYLPKGEISGSNLAIPFTEVLVSSNVLRNNWAILLDNHIASSFSYVYQYRRDITFTTDGSTVTLTQTQSTNNQFNKINFKIWTAD